MRRFNNQKSSLMSTGIIIMFILTVGVSRLEAINLPKGNERELKTFSSAGHVIGFGQSSVHIAAKDRMLRVEFVGARDMTPRTSSDAFEKNGNDAAGIIPMSRVSYPQAWEGVTIVYEHSEGTILKSSYHINPVIEGHPENQIRLRYNRPVLLDERGNLIVTFDTGVMTESAPIAWQDINGERRPVQVAFNLLSENEIGFIIGDYDRNYALVIDPSLTWNTFLGAAGIDYNYNLTVDGSGNSYVTGWTTQTWGSPVRAFTTSDEAYVAKIDTNGNLVWNTFLGGSGNDAGRDIKVDGSGNIYVVGDSSAAWGSPVRAYTASDDVFVAKLASNGSLTWLTFLGAGGWDNGHGVDVDGSGNVYVAGYSGATWGTPVRSYTGNYDGFAAKLNSSGSLTWNTFFGASGVDYAYDLDEQGGNVYVVGSGDASWGSPVRSYSSGADTFVVKLDSSGNLTWNTFIGGNGTDESRGILADSIGNSYHAGRSSSAWGSPIRAFSSSSDAYVAKLDTNGNLTWHTFLGGSGYDFAFNSVLNGSGDLLVVGRSDAAWGSPWRSYTSGYDAFTVKLTSAGTLLWSAFFGGSGGDYGYGIGSLGSNIYIGGNSNATWGSPVLPYNSSDDIFVAKILDVPSTIIGDGTAPSNKTVNPSDTNRAVSTFTLSTTSGTDTLTDLTITRTGTGNDSDVTAVIIYEDKNGDNEYDTGDDPAIASTTLSSGNASFTGLSISVTTTETKYIIAYDIASAPGSGNTLLAAVTAATVTTNNPPIINDTTDATLTIPSYCNVTTKTDGVAGSLRNCIIWANGNAGADTIIVPAEIYNLTVNGTGEDASAMGDLDITESLTITGAGASSTIIDALILLPRDRVFHMIAGDIYLDNLTIRNGDAGANEGGGIFAPSGGASSLTLTDVVVSGNNANHGGGIRTSITTTLNDVEVSGNIASFFGGGIRNDISLTWNGGTASGNNGANGGGVANIAPSGVTNLTNVTLSGNTATTSGGGFYNERNATLTNVTIYGNNAPTGAGIRRTGGAAIPTVYNSIIANNTGGNCNNSMTTGGGNLESATNTCSFSDPTDQVNVTAGQLNIDATLKYNSGPTKSHALLSGSFAIDEAVSANCPAADQRGTARGIDGDATPDSPEVGDCDIGAFEYDPSAATTTIGDGTGPASRNVWASGRLFGVDVFTTQTSSGSDTLTDLTITFDGTNVSDVVDGEVKLWKDDGGTDNEWDITDTYIGKAALFDVFDAKFSGLSEAIGTTATRYIITYDINGSASTGNVLRGEVSDATVSTNDPPNISDNIDATLTVQADSVHETSIYKAVYSPGSLEELYFKGSSSPLTNTLDGMSLGSLYGTGLTPGSLLIAWDPDTTVSTSVSNSAVKHVQMSGRLMHPTGNQYGTIDTDIAFYEDRIVFDVTIDVTTDPPGINWMFMTYGQWGSAMSNNFKYSSNLGAFTDQVASYTSSGETEPISYQTFFEMGATDGLVNATMQSISGFNPSGLKNIDNGGGTSFDVAYQLTVPVSTHHTSIQYSFDTTTSGLNATLAEQRQNDFFTPATMNFGIAGGDGSVVGDGYEELRGAYTLSDGDADDHVRFQFEPTTTHHAPVFEVTGWNSGAPGYIDVGGVLKTNGTHYNAAVTGTTLYLQYLSNISANTIIEIPSTCPGFVVTTTADSGMGSLRACIDLANTNPGADTITFNIPGGSCPGGVCTIQPTSGTMTLNDATGGTTIDGYTQTGAVVNSAAYPAALNGTLAIELDGSIAGAVDGLTINSANNMIKGLVINGFNAASKSAINIDGASATGNTIEGVYLGTNTSGTAAAPNNKGIQIGNGASGNTIGGNTAAKRNIISGNTNGIVISSLGTDNTIIHGNYIGIGATGAAAVANTARGIWVNGGDGANIGGAGTGEGNIISANALTGISLWNADTTNTIIYGNTIGTGLTGTETNLGNGWYGVEAMTGVSGTMLGGVSSGQGNEVAYSGRYNVWIVNSVGTGNEIKGNEIHDAVWDGIGSEADGILIVKNISRDNTLRGIYLNATTSNNTKIYHNTIHGNTDDGIEVSDAGITGTIIKNNIITANGGWGIDNSVGATITNDYNNVPASPTAQGNTSGSCTGCSLGSSSLAVDPAYNDEPGDDYTLNECTSPAINTACDLGAAGDDTFCDSPADGAQPDMNGGTAGNFNNNAPDMGAYETSDCAPGLSIVKQVWEEGGTAPLGNPTAPVGATLVFLIYVKNTTAGPVSDLRINDDLDEAGFEYVAGSMVRTDAGSPPLDTATDTQIFDATASGTGTDLLDPMDADVASAQDTGDPGIDIDKITIGAVVGQANANLNMGDHETFALRFKVKVK